MKQGHNLGDCRQKTNLYPNLYGSFENCMLALHTSILFSSSLRQLLSHPCLFLCASWDWGWALGHTGTLWTESIKVFTTAITTNHLTKYKGASLRKNCPRLYECRPSSRVGPTLVRLCSMAIQDAPACLELNRWIKKIKIWWFGSEVRKFEFKSGP